MIKVINEMRINSRLQWLTSVFIFVSASPLFGIFSKLATTTCIVIAIYIVAHNRTIIRAKDLSILAALLFFVTIYGFILDYIFSSEISYQGLGFFLFVYFGFMVAQKVSRTNFFLANEALVGFTLIIGLPIYLLSLIYPEIVQFALNYNYGGFDNKTFIFTNLLMLDEYSIKRFVGFGSEPGLTQIFYLLALFSRLSRNGGKVDAFLLTVLMAIFFSKSTFGILVAILLLANLVPLKALIKYLIIFSPIIYFTLVDELAYHFSTKLVGSDSFSLRYDRYIEFFGSDLVNVIFGYGNYYYLSLIAPFDLGGWDSFLQVSQRYGLIFVFLLLLFLFVNNRKSQFPVFAVICLSFFVQSIWFISVIAYFYFEGCGAYENNSPRKT